MLTRSTPARAERRTYSARLPVVVFVTFLAFFCLTSSGHVQTIDVAEENSVSQALLHGHLWITDFPLAPGGGAVRGVGGHLYAPHDIGLSILVLPVSALYVSHVIHKQLSGLLYTFPYPLLGAGLLAVFFALARRVSGSAAGALAATVVAGLTTPIWWYSHSSFDAIPTGFFVTVSGYAAWRFSERPSVPWALLAGGAAGAGIEIREDTILFAAVLCGWVAFMAGQSAEIRRLRYLAALGAPLLAAVVLTLWYNWARFGSVLDSGHDHDPQTAANYPLLKGAASLLVSPGKGLLFFAPTVLIAAWGLRRLWGSAPDLVVVIVSSLLLYAGFFGRLHNWSGAEAWGPRFLVPILGVVLLPLAVVLSDWRHLRTGARVAAGLVILAGVAVEMAGVATEELSVNRQNGGTEQAVAWHWRSQIYFSWVDFARSVFENREPYPSILHGGFSIDPVPPVDQWWAGEYGGLYHHDGIRDVAVAGLVVITAGVPLMAVWDQRRRSRVTSEEDLTDPLVS